MPSWAKPSVSRWTAPSGLRVGGDGESSRGMTDGLAWRFRPSALVPRDVPADDRRDDPEDVPEDDRADSPGMTGRTSPGVPVPWLSGWRPRLRNGAPRPATAISWPASSRG